MSRKRHFYNFPWAASSIHNDWRYPPLISVILPVYNQAKYARESALSVLNQSKYLFELIIIDDGSTDKLRNRIKGFNR
jgi:glycosyltransferase involved in cell wall biosynthesis